MPLRKIPYIGPVMTDLSPLQPLIDPIAGPRASALKWQDGIVSLVLDVSGLSVVERSAMEAALKAQLGAAQDVTDVRIIMTAERKDMRIIAVASGKGGVGKSTVSANLAIALAQRGVKVGLVDADIYGPSQPRLLASEGVKPDARDNKMIPVRNDYAVPMLSMGQLVAPGQAIAWRGPMAGNALAQLIDAHWSDFGIDTLIVDMPPGTGDIQLSMVQKHKPKGAIIVSTPQDLALIDATRAIHLFEQANVPVIGIVENMAGYICPHCGETSDPFGKGGAETTAETLGAPFLGRIPLALDIRARSDAGTPPAAGTDPAGEPFHSLAARLAAWLDTPR